MYNLEKEVLSDIRSTLGQAKYLIEECIGSASAVIDEVDDSTAVPETLDGSPSHDDAFVNIEPIEVFQELLRLRDKWRGDYVPDWKDATVPKYVITIENGVICISKVYSTREFLSFCFQKEAESFAEKYKGLIYLAEDLI